LTNQLAPKLAAQLVALANVGGAGLARVIFSDDGSTAIEAATKAVFQSFQLVGERKRRQFICLDGGYHGDTVGAMSVGKSTTFHGAYKPLLFKTRAAMAPFCYRCPFNKAKPEEADARSYRKCGFECVGVFESTVRKAGDAFAGAVLEPLVQGAAGMIMHPRGYLSAVSDIVKDRGGRLILDEVMTGFMRTGRMFAFQHEKCHPDAVALAKGLTGGYLPMAATLVSDPIVRPFMGGLERTFYHGHSYSGNQLGSAAAVANLRLLQHPKLSGEIASKVSHLKKISSVFWRHPNVGDVRQTGLILAVELVENRLTRRPFNRRLRTGWRVSEAARNFGLLTRPVGDVLLLMPCLASRQHELDSMVQALWSALNVTLPPAKPSFAVRKGSLALKKGI
jgi:adenosylmethionine-8-amino-7-oxononanoate aminotransferase